MPTKPNQIKRPRTEFELRLAVKRTQEYLDTAPLLPDDDHPALVFDDCIDELLKLRELRAKVAEYVQDLKSRLERK